MGITKKENYPQRVLQLSEIAGVLSSPARVAILEYIASQEACICGDLADELKLSQATVSQHLKILRNSGLIKGTIEGPSMCYCIDEKAWDETKKAMMQIFNKTIRSRC